MHYPLQNKYGHGMALLGGKDCFWSFGRAELEQALKEWVSWDTDRNSYTESNGFLTWRLFAGLMDFSVWISAGGATIFGSHSINLSWIDAKLAVSFSIDSSGNEGFCLSSELEFEWTPFWSRIVILDLRDNCYDLWHFIVLALMNSNDNSYVFSCYSFVVSSTN